MDNKNVQILINILIIILEITGFILLVKEEGFIDISYYTEDSNIILLFSSILILIYLIQDKELPSWLKSFRFLAVVSVTTTFIIVLTVLSWSTDQGLYHLLFFNHLLYLHTLCPLLAIMSFIFIEKYDDLNVIHGIYFTIFYAVVLIILNILKIVDGPYPFLRVYDQSILESVVWIIVIVGVSYLIAAILKKVNEKVSF